MNPAYFSRVSQDSIWSRRKEFHVLTYAEEGFAPLNIFAAEYRLGGETLRKFADEVNQRNEPGSLVPRAPISAVPRALIRSGTDSSALSDQIVAFLHINEITIRATKIIFDFRTPTVPELAIEAIREALNIQPPKIVQEIVVLE